MKFLYCKSWFRAKKRPTEVWADEKAKSAHQAGDFYTVLAESTDRPKAFAEVTKNAVIVGFLDELLRESLCYTFQLVEEGSLFLTMAVYRDFVGDSDIVRSGTSYIFKEDGSLAIQRKSFNPDKIETSEAVTDVTKNYTPYPVFGDYDDLFRSER